MAETIKRKSISIILVIIMAITFVFLPQGNNELVNGASGVPGDLGTGAIVSHMASGEGFVAVDTTKLGKSGSSITISQGTGNSASSNYNFFIKGAIVSNFLAIEPVDDAILQYVKLFSGKDAKDFTVVTLTSLSDIYAKPIYIKNEELILIFISKSSISDSSITTKTNSALEKLGRVKEDYTKYYNNFSYYNGNDRVYFEIMDYALTTNQKADVKHYTDKWIASDQYQITFDTPSEASKKLGSGKMVVNDSYLDWVYVTENSSTKKTTVTFKVKSNVKFVIITNRHRYYDYVISTVISLIKPASNNEKVIVLDAGHGGHDHGGGNPSISLIEKGINLDIALRVEKYLEDRGYNVFMTRQTDIFVGLYERAYIANVLNADIFMSIHNNGFDQESVNGTVTFYTTADANSSAKLKSKDISDFVQSELIKALGSTNRGSKQYSDLVVLKATAMPASLTEVGFMSNTAEGTKLKDPAYRQKAAEAIAKGLISSCNKLG